MIFMAKTASEIIKDAYTKLVESNYPHLASRWPILAGYNIINGEYQDYIIVIFKDTGIKNIISTSVIDNIDEHFLGESSITAHNIEKIRSKIGKDYRLSPRDSVVILKKNAYNLGNELNRLLKRHEVVMGVKGMKIFLSHKGIDKDFVREFKDTLELLGFEPWLDEDAMQAGVELERGIKNGFNESCAAVFFVTPNFEDENFLRTEVNYAMAEKRKKNDNFAIITLVFEENGEKGQVPELLEQFVWKEPENQLEALREIIKAIPLQTGDIFFKV